MLSSPPSSGNQAESERYRVDGLEVDVQARRVLRDGEEVHLTELSFDVFAALIRRAPAIVSKKELMREVWPGIVVEPDTVKKRIALLRESLGDDDPAKPLIRVARGRGYGIKAKVHRLNGLTPEPKGPMSRRFTIALASSAFIISILAVGLTLRPQSDGKSEPSAAGSDTTAESEARSDAPKSARSSPEINSIDRVAFQHYLEGRALRHAGNDYSAASEALERAIDIEPRFAAAHAELALCRMGVVSALRPGPSDSTDQDIRAPAQRALKLDPSLPEAVAAAAAVAMFLDWNWEEADALLQQGLAISPGNEYLQTYRSILSAIQGNLDEAIRLLKPAVAHDITYARLHYSLGQRYYQAGRYREAIQAYRQALNLDPRIHFAHLGIGRIRALQGDHAAAMREIALEPSTLFRAYGMAIVHTATGDDQAARAAMKRFEEESAQCCNFWLGALHAHAGDADAAFNYLGSAWANRETSLLEVKIDPLLEGIRHDPRYRDLLSRMNLD